MKLSKTEYEMCKRQPKGYQSPLARKKPRVKAKGRSSKCKLYSEEEIFLFKSRRLLEHLNEVTF